MKQSLYFFGFMFIIGGFILQAEGQQNELQVDSQCNNDEKMLFGFGGDCMTVSEIVTSQGLASYHHRLMMTNLGSDSFEDSSPEIIRLFEITNEVDDLIRELCEMQYISCADSTSLDLDPYGAFPIIYWASRYHFRRTSSGWLSEPSPLLEGRNNDVDNLLQRLIDLTKEKDQIITLIPVPIR